MITQYPNTLQQCLKKTGTESNPGEVIIPKPYGISNELGEINTLSHTIQAKGKTIYNNGTSFFEGTASRERFKSVRFKELALEFATDTSNRKAASRLNRIRLEEEGISSTTYRNLVEREGAGIQDQMEQKCEEELLRNGFNRNAELLEDTGFTPNQKLYIEHAAIENAAIKLNICEYTESDYESANETVNVSIDDVCVKRQTEMRPKKEEKQQAKRVNNTVIHVQSKSDRRLTIN